MPEYLVVSSICSGLLIRDANKCDVLCGAWTQLHFSCAAVEVQGAMKCFGTAGRF